MTTDNWFAAMTFLAVYATCLLLLDGAHRAHIAELKRSHDAEEEGMRTYIRTLNRERKWLENELAKAKVKLARQEQDKIPYDPVHIQWLPPSEEYEEDDQ